jgi:C3HC zinc finger-like
MPSNEALETTKRKFYKLLDNLSGTRLDRSANASNTTLAEPPSKRSRILGSRGGEKDKERPVSMPVSRRTDDSGFSEFAENLPEPVRKEFMSRADLRFLAGERRKKREAEEAKNKPPSKYAPWSQELFLERLKTFADIKAWTPKPEPIGEVGWAKRGWLCQGKDAVYCRMCEKRVVVGLKKSETNGAEKEERVDWWAEEAENSLVERYRAMIVEGHDEGCSWRDHGCKGKAGAFIYYDYAD